MSLYIILEILIEFFQKVKVDSKFTISILEKHI